MQQFEFINLSEKPQITDADAKRRVRAHAMRDFRSRKGLSETCDDQGFVKSSLDIARAVKQTSKFHRNRGDQSREDATPISSDDQLGGSPLLADTPARIGDSQLASNQYDGQEGNVDVECRALAASTINPRVDKIVPVRNGTASVRHARKQIRRSKMKDSLNSPTTSSSSDSDTLDQPPSPSTIQSDSENRSWTLTRFPGAGSLDPFDALPIAGTPRVQALTHHCKSIKTIDEVFFPSSLSCMCFYVYAPHHGPNTDLRSRCDRFFSLHTNQNSHDSSSDMD